MTTTKREDVLDGIGGHTEGPWVCGPGSAKQWGETLAGDGDEDEIFVVGFEREPASGRVTALCTNLPNATLISRAPALVDEIRTLRAVLSECAKQLAAMGATGHATRARTLLPDPPETRTEGEG